MKGSSAKGTKADERLTVELQHLSDRTVSLVHAELAEIVQQLAPPPPAPRPRLRAFALLAAGSGMVALTAAAFFALDSFMAAWLAALSVACLWMLLAAAAGALSRRSVETA